MPSSETSGDTLANNSTNQQQDTRRAEKQSFLSSHANGSLAPFASANHEDRHSIFSSVLKKDRIGLYKKFGFMLGLITIILWICLPLFFGSLYLTLPFISNLTINLVDLDSASSGSSAIVGPAFRSYAQQSNAKPISMTHLGFDIRDTSLYPNGVYDAINDVENNKCWAAVVIHANATRNWREAVEGNATALEEYDPTGSVGIYYMGSRFYQVSGVV